MPSADGADGIVSRIIASMHAVFPYKLPCQLCFVSIGLRSLYSQDDAIGNDGQEDGVPAEEDNQIKSNQ